MILTDGAAALILAILAGFVLAVLAVAVFGLWLAWRGRRLVGWGLVAAALSFAVAVPVYDRVRAAWIGAEMRAATSIPDRLDLAGRRVLFIEDAGDLCGGLCAQAVGLDLGMEADLLQVGRLLDPGPPGDPLRGLIAGAGEPSRIGLGAPSEALGGARFPELQGAPHGPPYDIVVFDDRSGFIADFAPDLLGGDPALTSQVQYAVLVFDDWPDPFAAPPPAPRHRSAHVWVRIRPYLFWPMLGPLDTVPSPIDATLAWRRALCRGQDAARNAARHAEACGS